MINIDQRFQIETRVSGEVVGRSPLESDAFDGALEHGHFLGIRRGALRATTTLPEHSSIEPIWCEIEGEPIVTAFDIRLWSVDPPEEFRFSLGTAFLREVAERAGRPEVESADADDAAPIHFRVLAYSADEPASHEPAASAEPELFSVCELEQPLSIREGELSTRHAASEYSERDTDDDGKRSPIFLPRSVLLEAEEQKAAAGGVETGGLLIGHLCRDVSGTEVYADVTALIPAEYTEAAAQKLSFTANTWAAVDAAIELRGRGERMLGWMHTHPARAWCQNCPRESWSLCPLARDFFSAADVSVHRTIFPKAFGFALVLGDHVDEELEWQVSHAVYGWHEGWIQKRGFHVVQDVVVEGAAREDSARGDSALKDVDSIRKR